MRTWKRLGARLRSERGFTLMESIVTLAILMTVMGAITSLMVSGTNAEVSMNKRFQAQAEARLGLDKFRREVHCASGSSAANPGATVTLTVPASCTPDNVTTITWCTVANGSGRYGLWRYLSATCSGTGRKIADYLTTQNAFTYAPVSGSVAAGTGLLATMSITLAVNLTPTKPERVYTLQDTIAMRNTSRPA